MTFNRKLSFLWPFSPVTASAVVLQLLIKSIALVPISLPTRTRRHILIRLIDCSVGSGWRRRRRRTLEFGIKFKLVCLHETNGNLAIIDRLCELWHLAVTSTRLWMVSGGLLYCIHNPYIRGACGLGLPAVDHWKQIIYCQYWHLKYHYYLL